MANLTLLCNFKFKSGMKIQLNPSPFQQNVNSYREEKFTLRLVSVYVSANVGLHGFGVQDVWHRCSAESQYGRRYSKK